MQHAIIYNCSTLQSEVIKIAEKSRAEYFRERRESRKSFNVLLDKEKAEAFEKKLEELKKSKAQWLNEKIDEELNK